MAAGLMKSVMGNGISVALELLHMKLERESVQKADC